MAELSELPPPRKGAKAGYYPDPLGSRRARWWDGASWSHMLGPLVAAEAARGKPVPPPTKVCSRCGAQAETFESSCPNCGRSYGLSTGAIAAMIVAGVLAGGLLIGGCAALIVIGVNEAEEEVGESAITREQYDAIEIGATRRSVEAELGSPIDRETFDDEPGGPLTCLYYPEQGEGLFSDQLELCFVDGRLESKQAPEGASFD